MLQSTKIKLKMSTSRERLGVLSAIDAPSEAEATELAKLTDEYAPLEKRYQGALLSEDATDRADDGEAVERRSLADKVETRNYVDAMLSGKSLDGAAKELNEAEGLETRNQSGNVVLPWAAIVNDSPLETRADAVTDISGTTDIPGMGTPWLTRLFNTSWIGWSGVTVRRASGEPIHTKITGGADARLPNKGAKVESDAMTISTVVASPRRVSAVYRYSGVDELRTAGMLSRAIEADVRRVMMAKIEDVVLNGAAGTDGFDGLLTATTATPDVALGNATTSGDIEGFLGGAIDGLTASMFSDLKLLLRPQAYGFLYTLKGSEGVPYFMDEWVRRGTAMRSTGHISEITGAAGESYILIFRSMGMPGAILLNQWAGIELIKDVYTRAQEDEVTCTARSYIDLDILREDQIVKERIAVT